MDKEFGNYFVSYKHYTHELLLFLYEILSVIIINHNARYQWYYLYDVICCRIDLVLNRYRLFGLLARPM